MKSIISILALITFLQVGITESKTDSIETREQTTIKIDSKHALIGKASYYGSTYKETRRTANGERFDKNAYTAAHKTLPFGSIVKVTNTRNGKTVTVRINDRGPFIAGRVIDITPVAAKDIDMITAGVVPCELEVISLPEIVEKKKRT